MPILLWEKLVISIMVIFAMPAVMVASSLLLLDRLVGTHFFNPAEGGDVLLYQHLFWFFGHPEVYIIFLPGASIISTLVPCFCRRRILGYTPIVVSVIATGFIGFGVWVHHMFATGLPQLSESFFTAASMLITIPTGVQIFCWITTLATGGAVRFTTPLMFVIGFFFIFIIGGLTGVMLGSTSLDSQLHDNYFVVAHLHYVLIGGAIFPLFGAVYYWFPKITGRLLSERAGKWNFWLFFIGFNVTFFPMHVLGLDGMTRRIYTYDASSGWTNLNLLATVGALIIAVSVIVFFVNVVVSLRAGAVADANPWGGKTLEWATSSPPPPYGFEHVPVVESRYPLKDAPLPIVVGLPTEVRTLLVTRLHDAEPDHVAIDPNPTIWPLLGALATTGLFVASIFTPWGLVWGAIPVTVTLIGWFWPNREEAEIERRIEVKPGDAPPPQTRIVSLPS